MRKFLTIGMFWITGIVPAAAGIFTYDFEALDDGTSLTSQYDGINFSNATVLKTGISLNELSFPPSSGDGVVFDDGGPIIILFSTPAQSVSGFFTYLSGIRLTAYDRDNNLLASVTSSYETNLADGTGAPGSRPNELLGISAVADQIASIVISATTAGGSLALDDLRVITLAAELPEPSSLCLVMSGLALAWYLALPPRKN